MSIQQLGKHEIPTSQHTHKEIIMVLQAVLTSNSHNSREFNISSEESPKMCYSTGFLRIILQWENTQLHSPRLPYFSVLQNNVDCMCLRP